MFFFFNEFARVSKSSRFPSEIEDNCRTVKHSRATDRKMEYRFGISCLISMRMLDSFIINSCIKYPFVIFLFRACKYHYNF